MRIIVSKAYLKWRKANKNNIALGAIDKFLTRVAGASDATSIIPQPKAVGNNLRKVPGVVDEFSLARQYRVYSKCLELTPGVVTYCLAIVGSKGMKNQTNDILTALGMFDDVNAIDWDIWEPLADPTQTVSVVESVDPAPVASDDMTPDVKAKKNKGKPVDENGMTVAERKALRKKQQQEQMVLARQAKEQKRLAEKQKALAEQQKQTDNQPVSESPVVTNVVENNVEPIVPTVPEVAAESVSVVPDNVTSDANDVVESKDMPVDESDMIIAERKALRKKQLQERLVLARQAKKQKQLARQQAELAKQQTQTENATASDSPVATNASDNDVEPIVTPVPEVVADSAPADKLMEPTTDTMGFKDYTDIQYQLEIIRYKMNIERLNIKIAQHEIELEKLAMQRLELLRMNKTKSM